MNLLNDLYDHGPWFFAAFDGDCSRGCGMYFAGDSIRADGSGGYECLMCVEAEAD